MKTKALLKMTGVVFFISALTVLCGLTQAQTVTTDKPDYYPGDTAFISGEGWWAEEQIEIIIYCTLNPDIPYENIIKSNAEGQFSNLEFLILDEHLGEEFILYAKGLSSGLTASTTFTDTPKIKTVIVGSQHPDPVTAGSSATYNITVNRGSGSGSSGSISVVFSITTALPAGVSATFTALTIPNGVNSGTSTLTLSTSGNTPSGAVPFTVKAATGSGSGNDFASGNGTLNVCVPPDFSADDITTSTGATTCGASVGMGDNITLHSGTLPVTYSYSLSDFGEAIPNPYTFPAGITKVYVKAENDCGEKVESFTVTVTNDLPEIKDGLLNLPADPVRIGDPVTMTANFTDDNLKSATWYLSPDGTSYSISEAASLDFNTKTVTGTFYLPAGIYSAKLVIEDYCGEQDEAIQQYLVIYDPDGGFVTGGGWIYSPPGALTSNTDAEGKAKFGFVAKYRPGINLVGEVDGNTNFQFTDGDFHFKSSSHENMSLVVSGAKATYKGVGTVNGKGSHKFLVSAIDGEVNGLGDQDRFRIKIYQDGSTASVLYDNQMDAPDNADASTVLGGGSIVIHTKMIKSAEVAAPENQASANLSQFTMYPNPFNDRIKFEFVPVADCNALIDIFDMTGRLVQTVFSQKVKEGVQYNAEWKPGAEVDGTYIFRMVIENTVETGKVVYIK